MATATEMFSNSTVDHYSKVKELIEDAERRAINRHKYVMMRDLGQEVDFEAAAQDWFANCAREWHEKRHQRMLEHQRAEIDRYKWIVSERAKRDMGGMAVKEWIHNYAALWRIDFEANYDDEA